VAGMASFAAKAVVLEPPNTSAAASETRSIMLLVLLSLMSVGRGGRAALGPPIPARRRFAPVWPQFVGTRSGVNLTPRGSSPGAHASPPRRVVLARGPLRGGEAGREWSRERDRRRTKRNGASLAADPTL